METNFLLKQLYLQITHFINLIYMRLLQINIYY